MTTPTDLLNLIGHDVRLKKIANTGGGEYAGACPLCGAGVDRLRVWPNADRPSWWCRHCGKGGDAIQYLREQGLSYHDACRQLGTPLDRPRASIDPAPPEPCEAPSEQWRETAAGLVFWSQAASRLNTALPYLTSRGLTERTIRSASLGYNPEGRWSERSKWGLAPDRDGNTRLWLPAGIVIPWYAGGALWKVAIRRDQVRDDQDRYKTITGSSNALYNADALHAGQPAILVEGVFDALAVQQTAGDRIASVASGTSGARRIRWITQLACCSEVLIALDADTAGDTASRYWLDVLPSARRLRPYYADPAQMLQDGQDVRAWALAGLSGGIVAPWAACPDLFGIRTYWQEEARLGSVALERLQRICQASGWDYTATLEELQR
jgi:DNA primase